jgi:hypothetical protein
MRDLDHYKLITELILKFDSTTWLSVLQYMNKTKTLDIQILALKITLDLNKLIQQCPPAIESVMIKGCIIIFKDRDYQKSQLRKLGIDSQGISTTYLDLFSVRLQLFSSTNVLRIKNIIKLHLELQLFLILFYFIINQKK